MYSAQHLQRVFWWNQRALNMFQRAQNSSDNSSRNFIWWKYARKVSVILISKMFKIQWGVETSYFICSQTLMKYQISLSRIFFNIGIFQNFANFIKKRDSNAGVFLWNWRNFSEHLSYRTLPEDCFYRN